MTPLQTFSALVLLVLIAALFLFIYFARRTLFAAFFPPQKPSIRATRTTTADATTHHFDQLTIRGFAKRDAGDYAGAIADFQAALATAPTHPDAPAIHAQLDALQKRETH